MAKYYAWFVGEEPDDDDRWSYDAPNDYHSEAAEEFLDYAHGNMDGWEWMPKDNGRSIVRVQQAGSNTHKDFTFALDYEPVFYAYEKTE